MAAGVALGIYLWTVFGNGHVHKLLLAHMIIGLIAFGLLLIQASAALILRPHPQSKYRCAPGICCLHIQLWNGVGLPWSWRATQACFLDQCVCYQALHAPITHACMPLEVVGGFLLEGSSCTAVTGSSGAGSTIRMVTSFSWWRWQMRSLGCSLATCGALPFPCTICSAMWRGHECYAACVKLGQSCCCGR